MIAKGGAEVRLVFTPGMSAKKVADYLHQQNILQDPWVFMLFARLSGNGGKLKAGEYLITPGMSASELVKKMVRGDAINHAITMVEGWTFAQIIKELNNNPYLKHEIVSLSQAEIMQKIGHFGELSEGRFAPDTYLFSGEISDLEILINAYMLMEKRLMQMWNDRAPDLPYKCPYEALIVASLIEKETADIQEKPLIAGVILQRIKQGMRLQIDPTVIYGLGAKYKGVLKKKDLLFNSSYNTYIHKGLPPTPICMPGVDSIRAALHPIFSQYLYYVAKGDGTHHFSGSLQEQNSAIKKYILRK